MKCSRTLFKTDYIRIVNSPLALIYGGDRSVPNLLIPQSAMVYIKTSCIIGLMCTIKSFNFNEIISGDNDEMSVYKVIHQHGNWLDFAAGLCSQFKYGLLLIKSIDNCYSRGNL